MHTAAAKKDRDEHPGDVARNHQLHPHGPERDGGGETPGTGKTQHFLGELSGKSW